MMKTTETRIKTQDRKTGNLPGKRCLVIALLGLVCLSGSLPAVFAEAEVKIKILAVNPSQSDAITASINQALPPEIAPEDIIDKAGMDVKFDKEMQTYSLAQDVQLAPRETKTIIVKVKNVWTVPEEMIETVRVDLENNVKALQGTKYEEPSQMLYQRISDKLAEIETDKAKSMGIHKQIELYRAHVKELEEIHRDVISIDTMRQLNADEVGELRTVKFIIQAENPSKDAQTMRIEAYLPDEITAGDIVDKLDFNLLYDEDRHRFSLYKEYDFQAQEKKTFEITLKDIWYIPVAELNHLEDQTKKIIQRFEGSNFENYARQSGDFIYNGLDSIRALQNEVGDSPNIEDRIRAFALNSERLGLVREKIKELQDLMLEVPLKRELDEFEKIRQAVKELSKVIDILRLGFTPDLSTTWWIILGILAFLFIMSASFYVTWLAKLGESQFGAKKSKNGNKTVQTEVPPVENAAAPDDGGKKAA